MKSDTGFRRGSEVAKPRAAVEVRHDLCPCNS